MNTLIGILFVSILLAIAFLIFGLIIYFVVYKWLKLI
jgi:hypothetical protein